MSAVDRLRIGALRLLCPDPAATSRFYTRAFDGHCDGGRLTIGGQCIVFAPGDPIELPFPPSNATSFQHCAIIVSDMTAAMARLASVGGWTAISRDGPVQLPESSGGVIAFKFRDPDGHPLELLAFPPEATPSTWRGATGLFAGIDHTAITVADTERSVRFYADLGFGIGSRGVNRGETQALLDAVDDPTVEVTALMPPGGSPPHLELLCYRQPRTVEMPAPDGDALGTCILLEGVSSIECQRDPDGHRFEVDRRGG